jgi:hypothetical protein
MITVGYAYRLSFRVPASAANKEIYWEQQQHVVTTGRSTPYMSFMLLKQVIHREFFSIFRSQENHGFEQTPHTPTDAIQLEIYRLEQSLKEMATHPSPRVRNPRPLTEQQKIIDLAG